MAHGRIREIKINLSDFVNINSLKQNHLYSTFRFTFRFTCKCACSRYIYDLICKYNVHVYTHVSPTNL